MIEPIFPGPLPQLRRHRAAAPALSPGTPHRGGWDGERAAVRLGVDGGPRQGVKALDLRDDGGAVGLAVASRQEGT